MSANRFYTIMVVPEKTSNVKKLVIPAWLFKGTAFFLAFFVLLGVVMLADYWYVMNQISENQELRAENRKLRSQVQVFKSKMSSFESTMDRIKTFSTRLKVITNIEDRSNLVQSLNAAEIPVASENLKNVPASETLAAGAAPAPTEAVKPDSPLAGDAPFVDPEVFTQMDGHFKALDKDASLLEQTLQDQYELLADKKAFLTALPVRKPVIGYYTSGFGIRKAPYGGRVKMHEGLDIANRPGTPIRSPAEGTIVHAEPRAGYGQVVVVDHGYGIETWYGHTSRILVKKGEHVKRGQSIALVGNTGRSTGPHLHYEVRINGTPVDPLTYILEN